MVEADKLQLFNFAILEDYFPLMLHYGENSIV